jgi:hypothetical protein
MKRRPTYLFLFAVLFSFLRAPASAQSGNVFNSDGSVHHDPELLDKLYGHDFAAISDAHWSRVDQNAVIQAYALGDCSIKKGSAADLSTFIPSYLQYVYGGGDVPDGQRVEFLGEPLARPLIVTHPTLQVTVAALAESKCGSSRMKTIGNNLLELIQRRIAWREDNGAAKAKPSYSLPLRDTQVPPQTRLVFMTIAGTGN